MATISRFHAVVSFKGIRLSGFLGWLMWLVVHITFLTSFKDRLSAAFHWMNTFGRPRRAHDHASPGGRPGSPRHAGGDTPTGDHGGAGQAERLRIRRHVDSPDAGRTGDEPC